MTSLALLLVETRVVAADRQKGDGRRVVGDDGEWRGGFRVGACGYALLPVLLCRSLRLRVLRRVFWRGVFGPLNLRVSRRIRRFPVLLLGFCRLPVILRVLWRGMPCFRVVLRRIRRFPVPPCRIRRFPVDLRSVYVLRYILSL